MRLRRWSWGRWLVAAGVISLVGGSAPTAAWAQPGPNPGGVCARPHRFLTGDDREAIGRIILQRAKERLGLSEQQADQIRNLLQVRRDEARPDLQAMCEARLELRQLLDRQDSDPAALRAAADRVKAIQGRLLDRRLDTVVAVRSVLTPDQWGRWVELRKSFGARWRGHHRGFPS